MSLPVADLRELLVSWELALRAERKSPQTVKSYSDGVRAYLAFAERAAVDDPAPLSRQSVNAFVTELLDGGSQPSTARSRQLAVRRFSTWLDDEGEIERDDLLGLKAPKLDSKVVEPLTDDEIKRLIAACGKDSPTENTFWDRRDEALVRFMIETGCRAGEVAVIDLVDVDLPAGVAIVRRGKGGKGRSVPFGPQTTRALDRYVRARRSHKLAGNPGLWLGDRSRGFSYDALHKTLAFRAKVAGVDGFHPHRLRHTAAHRWLAAGGSEGGLMAVAGWTRPDMLLRYTKAQAENRAAAEARNLNLGDL